VALLHELLGMAGRGLRRARVPRISIEGKPLPRVHHQASFRRVRGAYQNQV